jgi:hypothetical protein
MFRSHTLQFIASTQDLDCFFINVLSDQYRKARKKSIENKPGRLIFTPARVDSSAGGQDSRFFTRTSQSGVGAAHPNHRAPCCAERMMVTLAMVTRFRAARNRQPTFAVVNIIRRGPIMVRAAQAARMEGELNLLPSGHVSRF